MLRFIKIFKQVSPDIIYWRYDRNSLLSCVLAAKSLKIPIVFSLSHIKNLKKWDRIKLKKSFKSYLKLPYLIIKAISNRISYIGLNHVDAVISLNDSFMHLVPSKIKKTVIRNSVIVNESKNKDITNCDFLWVSNIKGSKNPELVIELAKMRPDYQFTMIGNIQSKSYEKMFLSQNLPDNLNYLGSKPYDEIFDYARNSKAMIHTCEPEGLSNNLMQAWIVGKPTVVLKFDPDDLIKKHQLGAHSKTLDKMVLDLDEIYNHSDLYDSQKIKNFAKKYFDYENNINQLIRFLKEVGQL